MELTPGQTVAIELVATPRNEAARKTLIRLWHNDPAVSRDQRQRKRKRPSWRTWRRGGRQWHHQMRSRAPVELTPGRRLTLVASVDVIRDLTSVKRWIRVVSS